MSPEEHEERQRGGLTRERLVEAALQLVNEEGLDGLSMRSLADRLDVKASSLYWHVRDRRELLDLLAEAILESVPRPRARPTWRETVLAIGEAVRRRVAAQKDANRILLEASEVLSRSDSYRDLSSALQSAGLQAAEAGGIALMVMTQVMSSPPPAEQEPVEDIGAPAYVNVDSGSHGVILRAGPPDMQSLIRVPPDQSGAAPAVVRGEQIVVRRLRGVGRGEIELNPRRPWSFKVQAPTWNTVLDLPGLDVRGIHVDSGAANVECFLPLPRGVVPLHISSGVVNVVMHRARGAAVVAIVHTGAVKVKLDDYSTKVTVLDVNWQSKGGLEARDRYELDVSSGVVDFKLDEYDVKSARTSTSHPEGPAKPWSWPPAGRSRKGETVSALDILLDGVEARVRSRS